MVTKEGIEGRIKIILIVGGDVTLPCGMCRVGIFRYGNEETSILCGNLSLSKVKKFSIEELYPYGFSPDF